MISAAHAIRISMSTKVRINVTVDSKTLRIADREARRQKVSRSEVFRTAVRTLATNHDREAEEAAQRESRLKSIQAIRRVARKLGDWPAEQIVHEWRYRLKKNRQ